MTILIGIDIGTTNWKVGAFDSTGRLIHFKKMPAVIKDYKNVGSLYDPDILWGSVETLLRQVVNKCSKNTIAGVSVSSMAESVVPVDKNSNPIFPIIPWFDNRARAEARLLVERIGKKRLFQITGLDSNPIFSINKILWFKHHYPDIFKKAVVWLQMADFIYMKLTGVWVTDPTLACRTLAYDIYKNDWSLEILEVLGLPKRIFPPVLVSGTIIGHVDNEVSGNTGLPVGTPIVVGGNDHSCATISSGVLLGKKILDSSGTAESFLYITHRDDKLNQTYRGQRVCSYLDSKRYVIWGGIIASGASIDWGFNRLVSSIDWNIPQEKYSYDKVMDAISDLPPGANGLIFLPHLRGSGAPYWDPRGRGAFLGLCSKHTCKDMMKAILEGLSYQARMIIEMEEAVAGHNSEALCVVGGGSKSRLWQQIKADVIGKLIELPDINEASALGAALIAGVGIGIYKTIDDAAKSINHETFVIEPNQENNNIYSEYYELYKNANQRLAKINSRLDNITKNG